MKLVLLPGMDGTGILFEPLLKALPGAAHGAPVRTPSGGRGDRGICRLFAAEGKGSILGNDNPRLTGQR